MSSEAGHSGAAIRLWHQGFVDFDKVPVYRASYEKHLAGVIGSGVEVRIHGLRPGTFGESLTPIEALHSRYSEMLLSQQICESALAAEREGYDAVVINCFYDPGLYEARSLVDIPVLSLFESAVLSAVPFGRRVGMLALNDDQCAKHRELATTYGFADRLAASTAVDPPIDEYILERPRDQADDVVVGIDAACRRLRAAGAEIVIPGDGVLNDFIWRHGIGAGDGFPMMDAAGALIQHGMSVVQASRSVGLATSRVGAFADSAHTAFVRRFDGRRDLDESAFSGVGSVFARE